MIVAQSWEGEEMGWGVIKDAPPLPSSILPSIHGVFSRTLSTGKALRTYCVEPAQL